jgi:hypothetical protein
LRILGHDRIIRGGRGGAWRNRWLLALRGEEFRDCQGRAGNNAGGKQGEKVAPSHRDTSNVITCRVK